MDLFEHFEHSEGDRLKDAGIARVTAANPDWMWLAENAFKTFVDAEGHFEMSSENIRDVVMDMVGPPKHPNAWGALTRTLVKHRVLTPTGRYVKSKHPAAHSRMVPTYLAGEGML